MVHHSQISDDVSFSRDDEDSTKIQALEYFAGTPGTSVFVKVINIEQRGGGEGGERDFHGQQQHQHQQYRGDKYKISCSMNAVSQDNGDDLDPQGLKTSHTTVPRSDGGTTAAAADGGGGELPEMGSVYKGDIQSIKPFGCFVKLLNGPPSYRRSVLVHVTQLSDHLRFDKQDTEEERIAGINGIVSIGDQVWIKIIEISPDQGGTSDSKISGSIKLVSQSDGTDLDPHNLKYKPRGGGGGSNNGNGQLPFTATGGNGFGLGAGMTNKDATIDWGHLKADVVNYGGDMQKKYDLVTGDDDNNGGGEVQERHNSQDSGGAMVGRGRGRGRGNVLPAWMSEGGDGGQPVAPGSGRIKSVEEALAILEAAGKLRKSRKKDKKKRKKKKRHKKEKKRKRSGRRRSSSSRSSTPSTSSSGSSDSDTKDGR